MSLDIVTVEPGAAREEWIPLLELADEPQPLRTYLHDGDLFGLVGADSRPVAAILVIRDAPGEAELRAVAVAETEQGRGLGTKVLDVVIETLRADGVRRLVVGTASSGVRQLAFYQRAGFRVSHVERDFFAADKGYPADLTENGIPVRDMVWMDRVL